MAAWRNAILVLFAFVATNAWAFEIDLPSGLDTEVKFWEQIFSKYSPDHCVFHDKDDLSQIYVVVKLPKAKTSAKKSMKKYTDAIQNGLLHLSTGGSARTKLERHIVSAIDPNMRFPAYYRFAMNNFRCQRGVDLTASIRRSKKIVGYVRRTLLKNGVPEDLAYLPHLESGYISNARSHAGARGLWQFMKGTARLWGLKVSRHRDDRINVWKSTPAAAKYFAELYRKTGSWPLAITAFNYGINGTMRAINQYGVDYLEIRKKHETAIFGFAAKNYFPSFIAARNVASRSDGSDSLVSKGAVARKDSVKSKEANKL